MKRNVLIVAAVIMIFLCLFSCTMEQVKPLSVKRNFTGSMWIVRNSISTPERIDQLLDMVKGSDIKNLFVQVRGRGDAYYNSGIEPKGPDVPAGFDPLDYLVSRTRNTDIRIHAWINISFVMNAKDYPGSPEHILSRHPEWATCDFHGRPITDYSEKELETNLLEGYFLDPAIPEVKQYYCDIIKDIISGYDIDGIHLDYIRYPYSGYYQPLKRFMSEFGYNPVSRRIFKKKYGYDPFIIDRENETKAKVQFNRFRTEQITSIVKKISLIVKQKNKSIIVSAAVSPRPEISANAYFQDWPLWLKKRYIDLACIMSYTDNPETYTGYIESAVKVAEREKLFMGIMVREGTGIKTIMDEITSAYKAGTRGYILFSFNHNKKYINQISGIIDYSRYDYMLY